MQISREETFKVLNAEIGYYLGLYETSLVCHDEEGLGRISCAKLDYIPYLAEFLHLITIKERMELTKQITEKKKKIMEDVKYGK